MSRKELVQALEAKWAVKSKYLGMPSCAYEITGEKGTFSGGRIMSMYSTECICMDCKEKERNRADYKQAAQAELDEVRKGSLNYKGIKG